MTVEEVELVRMEEQLREKDHVISTLLNVILDLYVKAPQVSEEAPDTRENMVIA